MIGSVTEVNDMFYEDKPIRFECSACGKCCTGHSDSHYIALSHTEANELRAHLGVSEVWFKRHYVEHLTRESWGIRLTDGQCVFLGKDKQCSIYHLRPVQCRTYPFWPELLDKEAHWQAEKRYCEGINRGKVVDRIHIRQQLQQQLDAEEQT